MGGSEQVVVVDATHTDVFLNNLLGGLFVILPKVYLNRHFTTGHGIKGSPHLAKTTGSQSLLKPITICKKVFIVRFHSEYLLFFSPFPTEIYDLLNT